MASSKKTILSAFRRATNETPDEPAGSQRQPLQQSSDGLPERLMAVPLNQLESNPSQPRSTADEEKLEELIAAILQEGLIQPIAVRPTSESTYQIIAGHRRVAAFQRLYERTQGTGRQRRYEAIPAIVKAPLDDLRMATTAFIENDQRENLNLVDEAAALSKIRDILSARLGREATAREVAKTVGKQDEQRVGRLFRFHEAPDVVKEGVIGQRLVTKIDNNEAAVLPVLKTSVKAQKPFDLHAALEFSRLHKYFVAKAPAKADEKTKRIMEHAREEAWPLRRIQGYVKAIISGTTKVQTEHPVFSDDPQRLTVYLPRLASASPEMREALRLKLNALIDEMDRLDALNGDTDPALHPNSSPPSALIKLT